MPLEEDTKPMRPAPRRQVHEHMALAVGGRVAGRLTPGLSLEELLRIDSRHGVFGSELSDQAIADLLAKAGKYAAMWAKQQEAVAKDGAKLETVPAR